uniref:CSON010104 protein n=1 Tax=Culicoides sonorensis TaxID=179676 RepID=A0A336K3K3_CULSO
MEDNQNLESKTDEGTTTQLINERISTSPTLGRRRGKCKWFNVTKGWGFITPDDGGQEVFVHQSVIKMGGFRSLGENEEVEFECKYSDKGLEATFVCGPSEQTCHGSTFRPRGKKRIFRKVRCYNCGEFANHVASQCSLGPMGKRCHNCKSFDHLVADCPKPKVDKRKSANTSQTSYEEESPSKSDKTEKRHETESDDEHS